MLYFHETDPGETPSFKVYHDIDIHPASSVFPPIIASLNQPIVVQQHNIEARNSERKRRKDKGRINERHYFPVLNVPSLQILELKKANNQKKASFASQAAAEATMRRLQASIKTDDSPALGMILAPLEAQIKSLQKEVG